MEVFSEEGAEQISNNPIYLFIHTLVLYTYKAKIEIIIILHECTGDGRCKSPVKKWSQTRVTDILNAYSSRTLANPVGSVRKGLPLDFSTLCQLTPTGQSGLPRSYNT